MVSPITRELAPEKPTEVKNVRYMDNETFVKHIAELSSVAMQALFLDTGLKNEQRDLLKLMIPIAEQREAQQIMMHQMEERARQELLSQQRQQQLVLQQAQQAAPPLPMQPQAGLVQPAGAQATVQPAAAAQSQLAA